MRSLLIILFASILFAQIPLKYHENKTPTYEQAISWYKHLDQMYKKAELFTYGKTDIGKPLHLFVILFHAQLHQAFSAYSDLNCAILEMLLYCQLIDQVTTAHSQHHLFFALQSTFVPMQYRIHTAPAAPALLQCASVIADIPKKE